jgi:hypothetical protein
MSEHTTRSIRLDTGELVTSTLGAPDQYATHDQAASAAATIPGAHVIQRGQPFYVRLPLPGGPKFCASMCGNCIECVAALHAVLVLDEVYESLSDEDVNSLHGYDEDDPRGFALDHKGRP